MVSSPTLCVFAACSHHLCHEITHLFGGALLHLPCDVGVGSQRKARVEVTKHTVFAECTSHYIKASTLERAVLEAAHCGFAGNGRIRLRCIKGSAPWGYNKQLPALFAALGMKEAVITCSEKNPADEETVDCLDALSCRVWQTVNGTVRVISNQTGITISQK